MQNTILEMQDVSLQYQADKSLLRQINLNIPQQSFHFITADASAGNASVGKTSLLKLISMHQQPNMGNIKLFGKNTKKLSHKEKINIRRRLGIICQDYPLIPHLNVFDNVALPLRIRKEKAITIKKSVRDAIKWLGLKHKMQEYPHNLSAGDKQKLTIVRACITKPDLLIADEATINMDTQDKQKILYLFEEMRKSGCAVIFATNDRTLTEQYPYPSLHIQDSQVHYYASSPADNQTR